MIDAGPLRHRVQIQQLREIADSYGQRRQNWDTVATVWASVEFLSGRELVNAQQVNSNVTHGVRMRFIDPLLVKPGLVTTMRLIFSPRSGVTKILNIQSINNVDFKNREMKVLAQENPA